MQLTAAAKAILNGKFFDMSATDDMISAVLHAFGHDDLAIEFDTAAAMASHAFDEFQAFNVGASVEELFQENPEKEKAFDKLNLARLRVDEVKEKIAALTV